jgi:lipopolysaccharide/colanic/teichoic acid biosynthesis glycosyltransferase
MELVVINRPYLAPERRIYRVIKRTVDVTISILALPAILLVGALCAVAIRLDSPGPILFVQERIGKDRRPFKMYKFRTMQHKLDDRTHRAFMKAFVNGSTDGNGSNGNGANQHSRAHRVAFMKAFVDLETNHDGNGNGDGAVYKPIQNAQITRVGRLLRRSSLDELPQIINVLKGEMSLVGPRPNVPWEVEEYKPWHYERLDVLPGITGLAQVRGRSGISFDTIVKYDIEYVEKQSLWLDLKVLWWSVSTVLMGKGAK